MLDPEPSLEDVKRNLRSVLPSSHNVSRSSTPGTLSLEGIPQRPRSSSLPPRPQLSPPSMDMAIAPACLLALELESHTHVKPAEPILQHEEPPLECVQPAPVQAVPPVPPPPRTAPSMLHIAHLLRLQKYHKRQRQELQARLHALQIAAARTVRLCSIARSIQRTLAECIRSEDRHSFLNLFNAFQDALDERHCVASDADEATWTAGKAEPEERLHSADSFLDKLQTPARTVVVDLLTNIRCDGDFLADRLASLTHKELLAMLPDRGAARSSESIFGSSVRAYSRASRHLGFVADGQTEVLSSRSFGSALETLIQSVRDCSNQSLAKDSRAIDVWSTVCARLIADQKPGSEKFVPAVLDLWTSSAEWTGKDRLGHWIQQTLQNGSFLVEQPNKQSFRIRVQGRPEVSAEDEVRAEGFYSQAVNELLDLLGNTQGPSVIPEPVLKMCRAIWTRLQPHPGHQRAFPHFVLTRWLFSPFFADAICLPEAFGLLSELYVSDNARQRILREVSNRAQKAVFNVAYSWCVQRDAYDDTPDDVSRKYGNIVPEPTALRVRAIMGRFQTQSEDVASMRIQPDHGSDQMPMPGVASFAVLSAPEVLGMAKTLYPRTRPVSFSSDVDTVHSGLRSSASSVSGFSLFKNSGSLPAPLAVPEPWPHHASRKDEVLSEGTVLPTSETLQPATLEKSLGLDSAKVWEACTGIEDLLDAARSGTEQWAALKVVPGERRLVTSTDCLVRLLSHANPISREQGPSTNIRALAAVIEQLLADYHEQDAESDHAPVSDTYDGLMDTLEKRIATAEDASEFVDAHYWFQQSHNVKSLSHQDPDLEHLQFALEHIERQAGLSVEHDKWIIETCEDWLRLIRPCLSTNHGGLIAVEHTVGQLRDKMWFVADVRTSAAYDEARSVAGALRIMGKPKRPQRNRMPPPLRHWNTSKLTNTSLHLKSEAQILELMSAVPEQGGPNKLSDDQARSTLQWMERNHLENLCRGEERLHRLCMEISKCVETLTSSENAAFVSNNLFARNVARRDQMSNASSLASLSALRGTAGRLNQLTLQTNIAPSIDSVSSASHALSSAGSREFLESRSPTLTHKSSAPFWSPTMTEAQSPSSATSIGSYHTRTAPTHTATKQRLPAGSARSSGLERLKRTLTSLLLSDFATTLFNEGSETDRAFWIGLGGELARKHLQNLYGEPSQTKCEADYANASPSVGDRPNFDYESAFRRTLRSFQASSDPQSKLAKLYDVDRLLSLQLVEQQQQGRNIPSTPTADRTGMRRDTLRNHLPIPKSDQNIAGFCRLFCNADIRPAALFRDLQYIATLVPAAILESTAQGKAFWNAAVAASQLKQDARIIMVETADSIIAYHSNNRGHGRSSSTAQQQRDSATFSAPSRTSSAEEVARYSMADAGYLLQITAREGDPVAQRELATLYLTHPELMDHIIAPFARPREVFKEELEAKWRSTRDRERCDPATMCVAHHWMSLSAKGGDALAKEYLRQREEMEALP